MRARWISFAVAVALPRVALADPGAAQAWRDIVTITRIWTNQHRIELEPFAGTSLAGGLYRQDAVGAAVRYHLTDTLIASVELRRLTAARRDDLPVLATSGRRTAAAALELGYVPLSGRLMLSATTGIAVDLVASAGAGLVMRDDLDGRSRAYVAIAFGAVLRFNVRSWFTVDLGIHDDHVSADPPGHVMTRSTNDRLFDPAAHDLEARLGIGIWFPSAVGYHCEYLRARE